MPNRAEASRRRRHRISFFRFFACCVRRRERKKRLSAKQQEGRAMATLDRQVPSPDTCLFEPWSSFVSAAKLRFVDSKFARRRRCCFCGQSVGKCVVATVWLSWVSSLHHAGSVKAQQSNCQKNITTKCNINRLLLTAVHGGVSGANRASAHFAPSSRAVTISPNCPAVILSLLALTAPLDFIGSSGASELMLNR